MKEIKNRIKKDEKNFKDGEWYGLPYERTACKKEEPYARVNRWEEFKGKRRCQTCGALATQVLRFKIVRNNLYTCEACK